MSAIVLDTDVSSALLRDQLADPLRTRLTEQTLAVIFVTVGECERHAGAVFGASAEPEQANAHS